MPGINTDSNTRIRRSHLVSGAISIVVLLAATPVAAAVSGSGFSAVPPGHDVRPEANPVSSDQLALARFNTGHRSEAVSQWQTQAERGDAAAQFTLAVLYNRGDGGVARDMIQAARWYRKAAEQGHAVAQYNLGILHATGHGVPHDVVVAIEWWRLAAMQGHAEAQFNLGLLYAEGTGVSPSPAEAVKWWSMAAEQGLAAAQFNLGLMYMKGEGIDENHDEALRLWRLSADQGFNQAISLLEALSLD